MMLEMYVIQGEKKDNLKSTPKIEEFMKCGLMEIGKRLIDYVTFVKHGVSPDHIGPMSLGFAHRPKFQPMTLFQNSFKREQNDF